MLRDYWTISVSQRQTKLELLLSTVSASRHVVTGNQGRVSGSEACFPFPAWQHTANKMAAMVHLLRQVEGIVEDSYDKKKWVVFSVRVSFSQVCVCISEQGPRACVRIWPYFELKVAVIYHVCFQRKNSSTAYLSTDYKDRNTQKRLIRSPCEKSSPHHKILNWNMSSEAWLLAEL